MKFRQPDAEAESKIDSTIHTHTRTEFSRVFWYFELTAPRNANIKKNREDKNSEIKYNII